MSPTDPPPEIRPPRGRSAAEVAAEPAVANRFPPGHFYSPIPDTRELAREPRRSQVWAHPPRPMLAIDWREAEQVALCRDVFARQERLAFAPTATDDATEYAADNGQYPPLDAWLLEAFLRHLKPRRMIEIGCGFSTLVTARANRELLDGAMHLTCIEPYPPPFLPAVDGIAELRRELVQDTPLEVFASLGDGDVLFIDTSHVAKTGSDVTWLYQEVLPRLAPGVVVHIHDVFLPGDYPEPWVLEGWGWNEIYVLSAFLAYNQVFRIEFGVQYMLQRQRDVVVGAFPGIVDPVVGARGGAALWLRKVA